MDNTAFANNLRQLRLDKNYTQEQVAEILHVSAQSVSRWECGNNLPDVMLLPKIAKIYCVTVDDLFRENVQAYRNYAQRLLAVYEETKDSEDFLQAEKEFTRLLKSDNYTADDLRCFGVLYYYMMKNCQKKALQYFDAVIDKRYDPENAEAAETYYRTCHQKMYLLEELERRGLLVEKELPARLANNCRNKF